MTLKLNLQRVSNRLTTQICRRYATSLRMYPVVEYPKSGGTWLCRMLAECMSLPFAQYSLLPVAMPCVLHGHWSYNKKLQNVTYLIRDGRDVVVSYYFHWTRLSDNPNEANRSHWMDKMRGLLGQDADLQDIRSHLPRFIEHIFANPVGARQNWATHTQQWAGHNNVCYVKYEDLREDCVSAMSGLLSDHGVQASSEKIERAVDQYSMKRMTGRNPGEEDSESFIRKGVVGDWRNHFTREAAEVFDRLGGDALIKCGYEQDHSWVDQCQSSA